jgi:hypothetical protein
MKLAILVVALAFLGAAPANAEPAPLQITAKVVEMPKKIIFCGVIAYRAVVRYEVISVDRGKLATKEVLVVELCPELLKAGMTRKLRLRPATKRDTYVDEFKDRAGLRWVHSDVES